MKFLPRFHNGEHKEKSISKIWVRLSRKMVGWSFDIAEHGLKIFLFISFAVGVCFQHGLKTIISHDEAKSYFKSTRKLQGLKSKISVLTSNS